MGKQIEFLHNELVNKNEIIKTLINDKRVSNVNHQPKDESTIVPVKTKNLESNPSMKLISNEMNENKSNSASVKTSKKSRSITIILGDSILKDIKPYKIRNGLTSNERVYVKSFPGATIKDMHEYVIPSMRYNPNLIALHVGTNDLRSVKSPNYIALEIIELSMQLKSDENDIMISSIIAR